MDDDEPESNNGRATGHSQDGKPFAPGNTREDGSYKVGRNRPPESGKFAPNDGRLRGRRSMGTKNFDTEFAEEAARIVPVNEAGKSRKVSKLRATIIRSFDNAYSRGQNSAAGQISSRRGGSMTRPLLQSRRRF